MSAQRAGCASYDIDSFVTQGFDTHYGRCLRSLLGIDEAQAAAIELEMLTAVSQLEKHEQASIDSQLNTVLWSRAQAHEVVSRALTPQQYILYLHDRIESQIPPLASDEDYKKPRYYMVRRILGHSIDMRAYKAVPLSNLQRQNIVRLMRPYFREKRDLEKNRTLNFSALLYYRTKGAQALDASLSDDQKSLYSLYNRFGFDLFDHGYVATTDAKDDEDDEPLQEPGPAAIAIKEKLVPARGGNTDMQASEYNSPSTAPQSGELVPLAMVEDTFDDAAFWEGVLMDYCTSDASGLEEAGRALEHRFSFEGAVMEEFEGGGPSCSALRQGFKPKASKSNSAFGRIGGYISAILFILLISCLALLTRQRIGQRLR